MPKARRAREANNVVTIHQHVHWDTNQNGVSAVSVINNHDSRPKNSISVIALILCPMFGMPCLFGGSILGSTGSWTNSAKGIVGIVVIFLGGVIWGVLILVIIRLCLKANRPNPATPQGQALEAGAAPADNTDQNRILPNMANQGGLQTNALPPGLFSMMAQQRLNIQPGFPKGTTQPVQQPPRNLTAAPIQPPARNGTQPYPDTTEPMANYPVAYPLASADSQVGVVNPGQGTDDIPSPPSYDDVITDTTGK